MAESIATHGRGRPVGACRKAFLNWVVSSNRPFTMRMVADALNMPLPCVNDVLKHAINSGAVHKVGTVSVPWSKRPVLMYTATQCSGGLADIMRQWGGA